MPPMPTVSYYNAANTTDANELPVSGWQGIREADTSGQYLITGTSGTSGILYLGTISGTGTTYAVNYPGASSTSVYGPNNLGNGQIQLVGTYQTANSSIVNGFVFQGTVANGTLTGSYSTIDYPGATATYVHSIMGGLAVATTEVPTATGQPPGPGPAVIYNVATGEFVANIAAPGSVSLSTTAYGIWYNGGTSYTIVGGFGRYSQDIKTRRPTPTKVGYLVDYNSAAGPSDQFSDWAGFGGPDGNHQGLSIQGISRRTPGHYTLATDSTPFGANNVTRGDFLSVVQGPDGSFGKPVWVHLSYPGGDGVTNAASIAGNQLVGVVLGQTGGTGDPSQLSYQATVQFPKKP